MQCHMIMKFIVKGVKKVCSAIKLCSYYFSYYVSDDISSESTHLTRNKQLDVQSNILSPNKLSSKSSTTQKIWSSRSKMGVYDKEPLSCPGHSEQNIS